MVLIQWGDLTVVRHRQVTDSSDSKNVTMQLRWFLTVDYIQFSQSREKEQTHPSPASPPAFRHEKISHIDLAVLIQCGDLPVA